jgi:TP901 family phage tail tape measure protein
MAQPFVLDVNLRVQQVLGLDKVKQQLAGIQVGGLGQVDKLSTGLKGVSNAAGFAGLSLIKTTKATSNLGISAQKTGSQVGKAAKSAKNFGDQVFLAGKRYGAFLGATVVAFKAFQVISVGTKSVIEFDQAMVSLSQIIGTSVDQLGDLSQQFLDLSVTTGTSAAEIANAAKLLAQAGFRGNELTEAVEQLAKVPLTPIFESMEQAVDGAIAAMRQFSNEGLTVETVFDKMINVSNKYAASFPDIIEGLKRGGSAFQAIGGTLDEFIAAFTTIRSETRESASAVGTSLKTLSSRLADPKIIKFLETKDIRLLEKGQFVGPLESMHRIGKALEQTVAIQDRMNIAVKLGGRRQISRFIALAQNMEKNNEILETSKNSFGEFNRVSEKGLQAVGKQIDILINKAKKLAIDLGESLFIPFIKGLTGAAEAAITLLWCSYFQRCRWIFRTKVRSTCWSRCFCCCWWGF